MNHKLPKNYLFRILFPVLYGSMLYILILLVFENFSAALDSFFSNEWMFTISVSYLSSEMLHFVSRFISRRITFAGKIAQYITIQIIATIVAEFLLVFLCIHFYFTLVEGFSVYATELRVFELFYLFSVILYNLFIFSYLLLNEENTKQNEQEAILKLKNEYQIKAVQSEIDPDVLYAAMESLLVYIHKDEEIANDIINRLSSLYRYRLENKYNEIISIDNEIEALINLLQLFKYGYPDSIELKFIDNRTDKNYLIIPFWLQKIVLTVIRCNIISPIDKFNITIDYQSDNLIIKHNWREKLLISEEVEIDRISGDFEFYTKRKIQLKTDENMVSLIIPLLNN